MIWLHWQEKQKARSKKWTRLCTMTGAWFPNTWSSNLRILSHFLSRLCATSLTLHCSVPWFWPSIRKHMALQWQRSHFCLYKGMSCSTKTISKNRNESGKEQRGLQCDTPGSKHKKSVWTNLFRSVWKHLCLCSVMSWTVLNSWSQTTSKGLHHTSLLLLLVLFFVNVSKVNKNFLIIKKVYLTIKILG